MSAISLEQIEAVFHAVVNAALTGSRDELQALRVELREAVKAKDETRPFSAEELMERLKIPGETQEARLDNLAARCKAWGLQRMKGTRGMEALYCRADVLHAEAWAAGKTSRRRHAA